MLTELSRALNSEPNYLYFMVTSRCNAFCDFCWNWKNVADAGKLYKEGDPIRRKELSVEEIDRFTKALPSMLLVDLFGGEPFIREELTEIIRLFVENARTKYISIPTNGYFTEKILHDVGDSVSRFPQTFFRLYLSIDGPEKIHNRVRKLKDGYRHAMETAKGLVDIREKHPNLSVSCNLNYNRMTAPFMEQFAREMIDLKWFDSVAVNLVRGEPFDPTLLKVDLEKYREIQKMIRTRQAESHQPFSHLHDAIERRTSRIVERALVKTGPREFNCFAAKKINVMTDQGDVFPCEEMLETRLGNIRDFDYDLAKLLKSDTARKVRASIVKKECDCRWECAINTSGVFDIKAYPGLVVSAIGNALRK